jgi:hypothetical protein
LKAAAPKRVGTLPSLQPTPLKNGLS